MLSKEHEQKSFLKCLIFSSLTLTIIIYVLF